MADKRISQLVDRGTVANNDVVPIVVSGATTTNKATISSIQSFMQGNLDLGVTSVGITIGSTGTDVNVTGSPVTSSGNITINIPTASATNRGLLSSADWSTFNSKQQAITLTTTGTSGAATLVSGTLNIPNYSTDLSGYVTLGTTQTITAQKTFTTSGSSDTMIISHGSGSGFALDVLKAGNGEAIRVTKTSGSGNAMTISGGNFEAPTIVKTGGTSSQFLKADGSVDSSTYLTTGSAASTYLTISNAASTYLPLAGGTLTGALNVTNANVNLSNAYYYSGKLVAGTNIALMGMNASDKVSIDPNGYGVVVGNTLSVLGALNGTSASFTGGFELNTTGTGALGFFGANNTTDKYLRIRNSSGDFEMGTSSTDHYLYGQGSIPLKFYTNGTPRLTLDSSTGAATFSSSVTVGAGGLVGRLSVRGISDDSSAYAFEAANSSGNSLFTVRNDGASTFSSSVTATSETTASSLIQQWSYNSQPTAYRLRLNTIVSSGLVKYSFDTTNGNTEYSNNLVLTNGNVGIGTASPGVALDVARAAGTASYVAMTSGTSTMLVGVDSAGLPRLFTQGTTDISFWTNSTERMRFALTGGDAYLRMSSSTGGIQFNGDTAAANALDDYEEGAWTPTVTAESGSYTTIFSPRGTYTKIGRVVTLTYYFEVNNKGTGSNACILSSLPFASKSSSSGDTYVGSGIQNSSNNPNQIVLAQNSSSLYIYENTGDPITATLPNTGTITYIT